MAELSFKHSADILETELVETFGEDVFNIFCVIIQHLLLLEKVKKEERMIITSSGQRMIIAI